MSVPRIAFFYWTGGPLPWLREQALVSFRRHHPDWEVVLGSPERRPVPAGVRLELDTETDPALPPAARSDAWRWGVLAARGGVYADTDVVFVRPLDDLLSGDHDAWITQDFGTEVPAAGYTVGCDSPGGLRHRIPRVRVSIGVLAARAGSQFFARLAAAARGLGPTGDYQGHGTSLVAANWKTATEGLSLGNLPGRAFYGGWSHHQVRALWAQDAAPGLGEHGVHWYGGSPESAPFAGAQGIGDLPPCRVRRAISG